MDGEMNVRGEGDVLLREQVIPAPMGASPEARVYLTTPFWAGDRERLDPDDLQGWKTMIAEVDGMFAPLVQGMLERSEADVERVVLGGVPVYRGTPRSLPARDADKAHLHIHGGGWAFMGGEACGGFAAVQANDLGCTTYSVDYRVPPEHRYPAALDDCLAVYRELLQTYRPENIVVSGNSAGGNLSAAVVLRIRDEGLPLPAAVALLTPAVDGALVGDTSHANDQLDTVLKREAMAEFWAVYAGGRDRHDPYLSPVYADYSSGFAPTLLQSGTRDLLLSDTVRLHRALRRGGVEAELHVWEAMPHGGFGGEAPEDLELTAEIRRFFNSHWGRARA